MANEDKITVITKTPKIEVSAELWDAFHAWMKRLGCTRFPEGLRAAMKQVTEFNPNTLNCQEKTNSGPA